MSASYIDGTESSTGSLEYLYLEVRGDGAWLQVYRDGHSLGIEIDADQLERLRQALREQA